MECFKAAGHRVFVWSAGGATYVEKVVATHGLSVFVDGCFDKDPRVEPRPDFIVDDDWYLVEKYGGCLVSQYRALDPGDRGLYAVLDHFVRLGHL